MTSATVRVEFSLTHVRLFRAVQLSPAGFAAAAWQALGAGEVWARTSVVLMIDAIGQTSCEHALSSF